MRFDAGTVTITGAAQQISNTKDRVNVLSVTARAGNDGNVYFGVSDVTATNGRELRPTDNEKINCGEGSVLFEQFYVIGTHGGDYLDWTAIIL